jgi:chromosome partitioning protein
VLASRGNCTRALPSIGIKSFLDKKNLFSNIPACINPIFQVFAEFTMPGIVGIIQTKGGSGRSTLATNLAAHFSSEEPTTLIDCDLPQGTSSSWYALRQAELPSKTLLLATARNHLELVQKAKEHSAVSRYLIIDGPPRMAEITRAIMILSDLCLIPLGASAAEIWSTTDLLHTLEEARNYKPDVDARLVWTRFRAQTREAQELKDAVQKGLKLKDLQARLGYRVAFSEALARGLSVEEGSDRSAQAEMLALAEEAKGILAEKRR